MTYLTVLFGDIVLCCLVIYFLSVLIGDTFVHVDIFACVDW